ncbi:MAG: hypothetical protein VXA40_08955 [Gammaproteobacteria bacterium]|jgi:hypothetical protein
MGVDVWEPGGGSADVSIDETLLEKFIEAGHFLEEPLTEGFLTNYDIANESHVMQAGVEAWAATEVLPVEDILVLIKLFTLIEALPGWDAGSKSPVIALSKLLKRRNAFTPDIRKWIKSNTDNRYLPYGSAL